jgi:hypothetical protein
MKQHTRVTLFAYVLPPVGGILIGLLALAAAIHWGGK